ncbi:MAG: TIGR02594 family protein [Rhizobiaceae bacterium]|nr:TIGR02594 family protein [Rhizobiaceae bacterium]
MSIILRQGSEGEAVKRLQRLLRSALIPPRAIDVDGGFGPDTDAAVRSFQRQCALKVDGIVGPQTWGRLGQLSSKVPSNSDNVAAPNGPTPGSTAANTSGGANAGSGAQRRHWMEIARLELGVSEQSVGNSHNARIVEYHATTTLAARTDEVAWCASFVNWVVEEGGYKGRGSARARDWLTWGRGVDNPEFGAVTVIQAKAGGLDQATGSSSGFHVAFYVSSTEASLRLLGGNQSDQVKYSNFLLRGYTVRGYRMPA